MSLSKKELKDLVETLGEYKGRHTELITVYVPSGYDINSVQKQLEAERSTAKNIKSTTTRNNVLDALEKIVRVLKAYKKAPENGLAIFCGNVSRVEGQLDLELWEIDPPEKIKTRLYRCDKEFVLEPLDDMLEIKDLYGLLVMDRKEATIGILKGKGIKQLHKMTSGIPSKIRAGGQSSQRFHRITEGLTKDFYKRIAEKMKEFFYENKNLKGLLVGGPVPTKDEFLDGEYLALNLRKQVLGRIDLGNTDFSGLQELVEKSKGYLVHQEIVKEKNLLKGFFELLGKSSELVLYKTETIRKALEYGAVKTLIFSEDFDNDISKELIKIAEQMDTRIEFVSRETEEGKQFHNLSGIGTILRYKI